MYPISHKTVFIIDQTQCFIKRSSEVSVDYDVSVKMKNSLPPGMVPMAPIYKSLWTCTVEAIQEYARIVYDIFPGGDRMISIVTASENDSKILAKWKYEHQNLNHIGEAFAEASLNYFTQMPRVETTMCLKSGLKTAIKLLGKPTPIQESRISKQMKFINRGRIILISSLKDSDIVDLIQWVRKYLKTYNDGMKNSEKLHIDQCFISIIHTFPTTGKGVTECPLDTLPRSSLSIECHSFHASVIGAKIIGLLLEHYNLAATNVTGIPMKEEQNASSSANYDVMIVHPAEAHTESFKSESYKSESESVCLKWCTPRNIVEMTHCTNAYRISPVDVNSRPSSCLTNFLLKGRTVMLEMLKTKGGKVISHMLCSHNGELYIHTLGVGRSVLEDPPSVSEGCGGRVVDYRINDFGELMKKCKLVPCKQTSTLKTPLSLALSQLTHLTLYFPLLISHTLMFNISSYISTLLYLIPQSTLTVDEVNECKNALYAIVNMESKGIALGGVPSLRKGVKREELYKLLWREIEYYIGCYATSDGHRSVLSCLRELHGEEKIADEKLSVEEVGWKEVERGVEKEKEGKVKKMKVDLGGGRESLLDLWVKKLEDRKRLDFVGRANTITPLYVNLNEDGRDTKEEKAKE